MKKISYKGYRFPPEIIQQAIWLYVRFTRSLRDVEDLALPKSLRSGTFTLAKAVIRWMPGQNPA